MSDRPPSRVLICDDQEMMRVGLRMVVESQAGLTVVGEVAEHRLDVMLLDVRMPGLDGVTAAVSIRAAQPTSRIPTITTFDFDEHAYAALRAGVDGFLVKDASAAEMLVAIRGVLRGDPRVSPSVTRQLLARFITAGPGPLSDARLTRLTDREREVLGLVARGLGNTEIAGRLHLGENTVKTHVGPILGKLGVRDRIGAVVRAYESGLSRPGDMDGRSDRPAGR
ncbi:response regulator [Actinoplanes sp. NPDC020271]|uniref:response regulator n=1 Tax=Actinoplanes sp. NPDC020271 TaxID=3363896 RepID=UPI003794AD4E